MTKFLVFPFLLLCLCLFKVNRTSSLGRFSLALEVGRPTSKAREKGHGDEVERSKECTSLRTFSVSVCQSCVIFHILSLCALSCCLNSFDSGIYLFVFSLQHRRWWHTCVQFIRQWSRHHWKYCLLTGRAEERSKNLVRSGCITGNTAGRL